MSLYISSAEPRILIDYSNAMVSLDQLLGVEANHLRTALQRFESTCRESAFQMRVSHIADQLTHYSTWAQGVDAWVRDVGVNFQLADMGGVYSPVAEGSATLFTVAAGEPAEISEAQAAAIAEWWAATEGKYATAEERRQAFSVRFSSLAVGMGLTLPASTWHLIFDKLHGGLATSRDVSFIRNTLRVYSGTTYDGQKILKGGSAVKELIGWSQKLTHIKLPDAYQVGKILHSPQVGSLVGQSALKEAWSSIKPAGRVGGILLAIGAVLSIGENWGQYYATDGFSKVASGTLVDLGIDASCTVVGAGIGAVLFGGAGFVLGGPVGAAAGAKIGGYLGSIAGSWYANEVKKSDLDEQLTNDIDNRLADKVDQGLDRIGEGIAGVGEQVGASVTLIGNALAPAVQSVVKLF
jgi:hypothetical protein